MGTKLLLSVFKFFLTNSIPNNTKTRLFWNVKKTYKRVLEQCSYHASSSYLTSSEPSGSKCAAMRPSSPWLRPIRTK